MTTQSDAHKRWLITFTNGDATWTDRCWGSYREAQVYADSLRYQTSTRFRITEAPDV